jgi:hypothetical protein
MPKKNKNPQKVEVYKNSDGFLTEDKKQYMEREKILKQMKKEKRDFLSIFPFELKYWSKTKEQRDYIDQVRKIIDEDTKNRCRTCNGKGSETEYGCFGASEVGCSDCEGFGLNKEYREKTGRNYYMEDTHYTL